MPETYILGAGVSEDSRYIALSYHVSSGARALRYHRQLAQRRLNPRVHINKIVALADIYGQYGAAFVRLPKGGFASYTGVCNGTNRGGQRAALHLTRRADLLDVDLGPADLSPYQP